MSSLEQRMKWRPGDTSPMLDATDVLMMLRVEHLSPDAQRQAVDDALSKGSLGPPSIAALRAAGWIETTKPQRRLVAVTSYVLLLLAVLPFLPFVVWAVWAEPSSPSLLVAAAVSFLLQAALILRVSLLDRRRERETSRR